MKNGTCPKCDSTEIITEALLHGSESIPPYISIVEPEPLKNAPYAPACIAAERMSSKPGIKTLRYGWCR